MGSGGAPSPLQRWNSAKVRVEQAIKGLGLEPEVYQVTYDDYTTVHVSAIGIGGSLVIPTKMINDAYPGTVQRALREVWGVKDE